jgi:hypothetical protein
LDFHLAGMETSIASEHYLGGHDSWLARDKVARTAIDNV